MRELVQPVKAIRAKRSGLLKIPLCNKAIVSIRTKKRNNSPQGWADNQGLNRFSVRKRFPKTLKEKALNKNLR